MSDKPVSANDPANERVNPRLGDVRRRVEEKYLGRARIHGVGMRMKENRLRIYAGRGDGEQARLLDEIRNEAAPVGVEVIYEDAPTLQSGDE